MLYPAMNVLSEKVESRYMLVNVTAKRARQIADEAEAEGRSLSEKPVRVAVNEIADGKLVVLKKD